MLNRSITNIIYNKIYKYNAWYNCFSNSARAGGLSAYTKKTTLNTKNVGSRYDNNVNIMVHFNNNITCLEKGTKVKYLINVIIVIHKYLNM